MREGYTVMAQRGVLSIVLERLFSFFVFVIILWVANNLIRYVNNSIYISIVTFLNNNLFFIIIFSVILLIGEIFWNLDYPFNLPSPILNCLGGILLVNFIFKLFRFTGGLIGQGVFEPFYLLETLIYLIVILAILGGGYIGIFVKHSKEISKEEKKKEVKEEISWKEIGENFKYALYEFANLLRKSFGDNNKKLKRVHK